MIEYIDSTIYVFKTENPDFSGLAITKAGDIAYFKEGEYHREDGPAVIINSNNRYWFYEGKLHRIDGPAVESPDSKEPIFWIEGEPFWDEEDWKTKNRNYKLNRFLKDEETTDNQ